MDDDTDEKDDTKRKSRNLSEKKRRDQFNLLVNELSSMVSASSRKMDKSTVLKSTIAYLKHANDIAVRSKVHEIQEDWKPSFLSNEEFTHLILEALDGFIVVFSSNGRIFYTSESITSLLGHLPSDLLSSTIYDLAYEEDHSQLYNILLNPTCVIEPLQTVLTVENQITFSCHLKRGGLDYQEEVTYELVQFVGYFRTDLDINKLLPNTRNNCYPGDTETHLIFVGTGRIQTPQLIREMSIVDSTKCEFTSRHSLEWKFLFLDHRAPPIIGYLPFEVLGTSGYDYYHFDDLEKVVLCHDALMQKGEGKSCYYRFLTKGQQWIWLQSRFYITYHQWNSKPEFVVCTHRVVSHADVMKQMRNSSGHNEDSASGQVKEIVGSDCEEKLFQTTSPLMASSTWTSKSSRASKASATTSGLPNVKNNRSRYSTCHATGSDSTSMSADSPSSRNSVMTQYSSRSRMRQNNIQLQQKLMENQHISGSASQQSCASNYNSPSPMHSHQSLQSVAAAPIIDSTFLEPQQYLAAIPLQPVIAPTFSGPAVLSTIPVSTELLPPGMVMTTNQSHIQDQLQRKHEELQKLIVQQQEELRRVSEQLLMARYGLLPPTCQLLNAPITYNNIGPNNQNRILNTTEEQHHLQPRNLILQHQQQQHHHHQISDNNSLHSNIINQDLSLATTGLDHQNGGQNLEQQQQHTQEQIDTIINSSVQSTTQEDEMTSYLQLTTVPSSSHSHLHQMRIADELSDIQDHIMNHHNQNTHNHNHHHHHLNQQLQMPNELEILPYQMSSEQSHLLFSSPNSSRHSQ